MSLTESISKLTSAGCTVEFHEMPSESGPHLNCVVVGFGRRIGRTVTYRDIQQNADTDTQMAEHLRDAVSVLSRCNSETIQVRKECE